MLEHLYENDVLVIRYIGKRIDSAAAVPFRAEMAELLGPDVRRAVLNLSNVQFIDSSGLGALVSLLKRLGPQGELTLCGLSEPVALMFRLTRMDKVFKIKETESQALLRTVA